MKKQYGMRTALFGMAITMSSFGQSAWAQAPTVNTDKGIVVGTAVPSASPAVNAFLGVPYAAPPVGALRLRAPQGHAAWSTPVQATQVAQPCTQYVPQLGQVVGGEHCLYLNVYAPAAASHVQRPVMVFIPGGGFTQGSASSPYYHAQAIVEQSGAIVVEVTYRVGALGFLTAPALDAENPHHVSGNYGVLDQQAALRWVNTNITAFGGDPSRVTLFGESAGADSTEFQLASPLAAGLFQRAIVESSVGTPLIPFLTLAQSESGPGAAEITNVGCSGASDVAACLRALPASKFVASGIVAGTNTYPVVDGWALNAQPLAAFKAGQFNKVPVIVGSNHDEFTTLVATTFPQFVNPPLTTDGYAGALQQFFGPGATTVQAQYPASAYQSPLQALATVMTDAFVACQTEAKRAALAARVPTYGYEFNEPNPARGPIFGPPVQGLTYGDYHTAELPYVFGVTAPNGDPVTGKDLTLSQEVISYWTNFAATSYPSSLPHAGDPVWPLYLQGQLISLKDQIATLPVSSFSADHKCGFWAAAGL
jgi:para-nitrobenzyl esterase